MLRTKEDAKRIFTENVEEADEKIGYFLTVGRTKQGHWTVYKWYSRNSYTDDVLERKVLLMHGKIFENKKQIGTY